MMLCKSGSIGVWFVILYLFTSAFYNLSPKLRATSGLNVILWPFLFYRIILFPSDRSSSDFILFTSQTISDFECNTCRHGACKKSFDRKVMTLSLWMWLIWHKLWMWFSKSRYMLFNGHIEVHLWKCVSGFHLHSLAWLLIHNFIIL